MCIRDSYRGAFGGHLANIFRRMKRICGYYHSDPQFLCSSATIANPVELAEKICGITPGLIERDGSPAPEKVYKILQPPEIKGANDKVYGRYSASSVVKELIPKLVEKGEQFLSLIHISVESLFHILPRTAILRYPDSLDGSALWQEPDFFS